MDRPAGTSQGPRRAALVALAIAALAGIATSATPPTAKDQAVGEIGIDGGTIQTRELQIHLAPPVGKGPTMGELDVGMRSAADIGPVYTPAIDVLITDSDGDPLGSTASTRARNRSRRSAPTLRSARTRSPAVVAIMTPSPRFK